MTALLAKAAAMALVQHPVVNASCKDGKSFTYNSSINIAVAVAINGGLITPVLQDADKVPLLHVEIIFHFLAYSAIIYVLKYSMTVVCLMLIIVGSVPVVSKMEGAS